VDILHEKNHMGLKKKENLEEGGPNFPRRGMSAKRKARQKNDAVWNPICEWGGGIKHQKKPPERKNLL